MCVTPSSTVRSGSLYCVVPAGDGWIPPPK
uniref:Uncharacterized protein n=1 Tax=Arundo donax TaxID=35708 RepID=A0A0A9FJD2_ARUDO